MSRRRWLGALSLLVVFWPLLPAQASSRRALLLTSLDWKSRSGGRSPVRGSLRAALIEHLELMGEVVKQRDAESSGGRCAERQCLRARAVEQQADLLYGDIEQKGGSVQELTLWLWRFDSQTNAPLTEWPASRWDSCHDCDEAMLAQKLQETAGALLELPMEPGTRLATERRRPLSQSQRIGAAILGTISVGALIASASLLGGQAALQDQLDKQLGPQTGSGFHFEPYYWSAFGISAAALTGLIVCVAW